MKLLTPLLLAAAAPLAVALVLPKETVVFGPSKGLVLEKTFSVSSDLKMSEFDMRVNGNPPPMPMDMEITTNMSQTVEVVDEYMEMAEGRPAKLKRTFQAVGMTGESKTSNPMMGEMNADTSGGSGLEGYAVLFSWDAESDEYEVRYTEDKQGDAKLLEDLWEDMDLRGLLPAGPLAVGDTYEIRPGQLKHILAPGGNLHLKPDSAEAAAMGMSSDQNMATMLGDLTGSASGELLAVREVDGRKIAVIRLKIDVESAQDMTSFMQEMMANGELPGGMQAEMEIQSADVELSLTLEGELHWDLAGGHFKSLDLKGEMNSTFDIAMMVDAMGQTMNIEQSISMGGKTSYSASAVRQ